MPEACDILKKADEFLSDKDNWTMGSYARYRNPLHDQEAMVYDVTRDDVKCCAMGACYRAAVELDETDRDFAKDRGWVCADDQGSQFHISGLKEALTLLEEQIRQQYTVSYSVVEVNDRRGYDAVRMMFAGTIEKNCK